MFLPPRIPTRTPGLFLRPTSRLGAAAMLAAFLGVSWAASVQADDLFLPVAPDDAELVAVASATVVAAEELPGFVVRRSYVRVNRDLVSRLLAAAPAAVAGSAEPVDLNLFGDASYRLAELRTAPTSSGVSLSGHIVGEPLSTVILVFNGDVLAGEVRLPGATYTIHSLGDEGGLIEIRQTDEEALPGCAADSLHPPHPPHPPPPIAAAAAAARDLPTPVRPASTERTVADVLVVYTPAAREQAGGEAAMEARVDLWFAATNKYYEDSGINHRIRLVHLEEMDGYVETVLTDDLNRLADLYDGAMDEIWAMRDAVDADHVHLIERWGYAGTLRYCGRAYQMGDLDASWHWAFGVTVLECGSIPFAHELGHNMALSHDRYISYDAVNGLPDKVESYRPYPYAFGYVNQEAFASGAAASKRWVTIMAYYGQCQDSGITCTRIGRFSNPAQSRGGSPLGVWWNGVLSAVTGPADAALTLNSSRHTAAAFRTARSAPRIVSLHRRLPVAERTNSDTLRWRIAFSRDVRNLTGADLELAADSSSAVVGVTVAAKTGSQRIYDIEAASGIDSSNGSWTLDWASGQDVENLSGEALVASWPPIAQRGYTLDNVAPTPTISPSTAGGSTFAATITFTEDVAGFTDASDITATNATVSAPVRSDARTYIAQVTPSGSDAVTVALSVPAGAATDLAGNSSVAASVNTSWDPANASALAVSGYVANGTVAENADWTSITPSVTGTPSGTVSWTREGADAGLFTINASTGVLGLPGQDFEFPADSDADNSYQVTMRATDSKGNTATAAISVAVTNVAESRTINLLNLWSARIPDGAAWTRTPYLDCWPSCLHLGGVTKPVTWSKSGADAALFSQNSATGALALSARDFESPEDADRDNDYHVTVHATDGDGHTVQASAVIQVIKAPPQWLAVTGVGAARVDERAAWTSATPSVGDPTGTVTWTREGPDKTAFSVNASTGVLSLEARDFEIPDDADGDNVYEVRLRATDADGNSGTVAVAVTVTDVAETPTPPPPGGGGGGPPDDDPPDDDDDDDEPPPPPPPSGPPSADATVDAVCEMGLCRALTGAPVRFEDKSTGVVAARQWDFGDGRQSRASTVSHSWSSPGFYEVTLTVSDGTVESRVSLTFLVEAAEPAGSCVADARTRCLRDSRYAVTVDWRSTDGRSGHGSVVRFGTNDSGLFSFFNTENWEVLVKLLDGCSNNGHVWVYGASATDLGYSIRVTDTVSGAEKEYRTEPGMPAAAITDASSFPEGCTPP